MPYRNQMHWHLRNTGILSHLQNSSELLSLVYFLQMVVKYLYKFKTLQVAEIKETGHSSVGISGNICMNIYVTRIYCPTSRFFRILHRGWLLFTNGVKYLYKFNTLQVGWNIRTDQGIVRLSRKIWMTIYVTRVYCRPSTVFTILDRECLLFTNGVKITVQIQHLPSCLQYSNRSKQFSF